MLFRSKLLMVAGEASGDQHGAELIRFLRLSISNLEIYGVGGQRMLAQGLRPYYMLDSLQVHGLVEVGSQSHERSVLSGLTYSQY